MPTVALTDPHRALARLAGTWAGEERINPSPWDPKGATAHAVVRNRIALGGLVLLQEYDQSREGAVVLSGHGVFSVEEGTVVLRWWDTWSPVLSEFRGGIGGDVLTLVRRDAKGFARASWRLGTETYAYTLEVSPDEQAWYRYLEATYRRSAE